MSDREKYRAVERLAALRLEHMSRAGIRTTYEREHAEAAKVARHSDASDPDRRRGMASNEIAKKRRADAKAEAAERRARDQQDTSSRPGETKAQWLARMRGDFGWKKG